MKQLDNTVADRRHGTRHRIPCSLTFLWQIRIFLCSAFIETDCPKGFLPRLIVTELETFLPLILGAPALERWRVPMDDPRTSHSREAGRTQYQV